MNSKIGSLSLWKITLAAIALVVVSLAPSAYADTVTINFDSLTVAADGYLWADPVTSYLAGYGVTLSGLSGGSPFVYHPGPDTQIPSPPNAFGANGPGNVNTFTLNFSTPVSNFSFDRVGAVRAYSPSGTAMGPWSATAYNASGGSLGSVGDGLIVSFVDVPIESFTLAAQGISYINFTGDSEGWAGTALPHIDNLAFTTSPVPIPATMPLLGLGLLGLAAMRLRQR